jgi:hypothetical protein
LPAVRNEQQSENDPHNRVGVGRKRSKGFFHN